MSKLSHEEIEKNVRDIAAIMSYENMELTKQDKENIRRIISGEVSADEVVEEIIRMQKHENIYT